MTVPMIRHEDGKTADVNPDEVENWRAFGWTEAAPAVADGGGYPTDVEMRAAIEVATGAAPHHRTGRAKLIEQFNAIPKG